MNVVVGEGASGALVSRRGRNPEFHSRPERTPRKVRRWWGGHAAYYGRVGPRVVRNFFFYATLRSAVCGLR